MEVKAVRLELVKSQNRAQCLLFSRQLRELEGAHLQCYGHNPLLVHAVVSNPNKVTESPI